MPNPTVLARAPRAAAAPTRWAVLGTYPPTACGLATFTRSLVTGMRSGAHRVDVVRVVDEPTHDAPGVAHTWVRDETDAPARVAAALDAYDVVVVQHEFGIYPGLDGEDVVAVLDAVHVPVVSVLHTVPAAPTHHQHAVLQRVIDASAAVVTMTHTAARRVESGYHVPRAAIRVIPHGAPDALIGSAAAPPPTARPVVLTWGLLGVGKGIEWGIDALLGLRDLDPAPLYVVAGRTHPKVAQREGERYRSGLHRRAEGLGLTDHVRFIDDYLDDAHLHRLIQSASVVLLPYDSSEQVTSGVLIEAVAAGRPVVATAFPHAIELLADGVGIVVPQRDPDAIAGALRAVLTDPGTAGRMRAGAGAAAPGLSWSRVAQRYLDLGADLIGTGPPFVALDNEAVTA